MTSKFKNDVLAKVNEKLAALGLAPMDNSGMTTQQEDLDHSVTQAQKNGIKSIQMNNYPGGMKTFQ